MLNTILMVSIICLTITFGITGLIILWLFIYNNYFKDYIYQSQKNKIFDKINKINSLPENEKEKYEKSINKYNKFITNDTVKNTKGLSINEIEIAERIKVLIDTMIEAEVYSATREVITLNIKYDILNLDSDIEKISTKVFNGINNKVMTTEMFFSNEYIMNYIIGMSFNLLLKLVVDHNTSLM